MLRQENKEQGRAVEHPKPKKLAPKTTKPDPTPQAPESHYPTSTPRKVSPGSSGQRT